MIVKIHCIFRVSKGAAGKCALEVACLGNVLCLHGSSLNGFISHKKQSPGSATQINATVHYLVGFREERHHKTSREVGLWLPGEVGQ